ncbi:Sterol 3-beta-glucosyltransferase UGT80B1 [Lachnellula arida]|uniref:Sterol 3-beta-glucosyltransferase UGT80B1 n=1 Tax=Lachnellula arida TaxID=1316785 RepID=A0A8T9BCP6_9HELO|nr:Sterol 3-beta-glucosyltransferase UGT80B1 [Lachnellula arida]
MSTEETENEAFQRPSLGRVNTSSKNFNATAEVRNDGRATIRFRHLSTKAAKLTKRFDKQTPRRLPFGENLTRNNRKYEGHLQSIIGTYSGLPRLNIAIHIVGSRGDVQPFIPIAQILSKPPYSHRVRICTHPVFKDLVEENGLEFFSIGGDPATLMAYMVKNPGLMPGMESLKAGDVGKRRADMSTIMEGCWRGCIEEGNGMGGESKVAGSRRSATDADRLFIADAIIANPPSYAHIHCAEKLGIPLHLMFTMPWSPTQAFPHPLASMDRDESDPKFANYISYTMMELLAWQGLGDVINRFRAKTLNLDPISPLWGYQLLPRMRIPFTYLWSPTLIPKPQDWGSHIKITGFSFLSKASTYTPPDDLAEFLKAGPPPVYIGFGSIVVDKPDELTKIIFGAVKRAGVRALVSKGWGGLGGNELPEGVFLLGNVPHDWLFQYVSCVVHHGGAGTAAIGIAMGKPTVVVPFFGDQPFWGAMIHKAGAGPEPVPYRMLTEKLLANSITTALGPDIQSAVKGMAARIAHENGAADAASSFQQAINVDSMRCLICPEKVAVWRVKKTNIRLSMFAASILIDEQLITWDQLKLVRHRDWYVDEGPYGPISGVIATASSVATNTISSVLEYTRNFSKLSANETFTQLDIPSTRNPVQAAADFPQERIEAVAYKIAAKAFPKPAQGSKKKIRNLGLPKTSLSLRSKASKRTVEHGRTYNAAHETEHFAASMVATGLRAPVAFFYNLANGFHNAPLYFFHDDTVRKRDKITGFGSGVRVAGKEFTLGMFDGFTGILTLPYRGAQKKGVTGFCTGVGKGAGALLFKTSAAAFGVPGYTLKGLEKQLEKRYDRDLKAKLITVRLRQGIAEFEQASKEQKEEITRRWEEISAVLM